MSHSQEEATHFTNRQKKIKNNIIQSEMNNLQMAHVDMKGAYRLSALAAEHEAKKKQELAVAEQASAEMQRMVGQLAEQLREAKKNMDATQEELNRTQCAFKKAHKTFKTAVSVLERAQREHLNALESILKSNTGTTPAAATATASSNTNPSTSKASSTSSSAQH